MSEKSQTKCKQTILVIVAHTDDETLGAGGTIAKHVEDGDRVFGISMTDGVGARAEHNNKETSNRKRAGHQASDIIGLKWLEGGNFPDNAMDSILLLSVTKLIETAKALVKPTIIYTHSSADLNVDHRVVSQATLTAFRPEPNECWTEIRTFEIPSATDFGHKSITNVFIPNLYIDITNTWKKKNAALREYEMEMRNAPHSRSFEGVENLARLRGNQVGLFYAEAFEIIRKIER